MSNLIIDIPDNLPQQKSNDLGPVPKGNYAVTVYDVKAETVKSGANAGKPRWNVQLRISEGQYENRRLFVYIPLYVAGDFWKTQSFFESLGYSVKGSFAIPEPSEVLGKSTEARVAIREAEGQYSAENNVSGFNAKGASSAVDNLSAVGATPVSDAWVN
jgi:hypothetical protein